MQKTMAAAAAWLFLLSLVTGLFVASAMTGGLPADARTLLASHLSALMGCFLLLGVASTFPLLRYTEKGRRRLGWCFIVACFANWALTALKAFLGVAGLAPTGERANDAIFFLLAVIVVGPFFAAGVGWLAGFLQVKVRS